MTPQKTHTGEKPLTEQIAEQIIQYILQHNLSPGDRLPNEYAFTAILGVGRGTVREAMRTLSSRGVVEIRQGAGTFVSPRRGVSEDPLGFSLIQDKQKLAEDLLAVRILIEPQIAAMAAQNASEEERNNLYLLCDAVERQIRLRQDHSERGVQLHTAIALCSGNLVVGNLIPIIHRAIRVFIDVTNRSLEWETISTHRELVEAIGRKDPIAAHDAMYLHLIHNRRLIRQQRPTVPLCQDDRAGR